MSYDPPTIMDKLHAIARVLGIDPVTDNAVYSVAESLDDIAEHAGKLVPIAERIAVALERLADGMDAERSRAAGSPPTTHVCGGCGHGFASALGFDDAARMLEEHLATFGACRAKHPPKEGPPA